MSILLASVASTLTIVRSDFAEVVVATGASLPVALVVSSGDTAKERGARATNIAARRAV